MVHKMKHEIQEHGPIACMINAKPLLAYSEVITDASLSREPDHVVEVVGWEKKGEREDWIVRNSWGTYWGDNGFFKIKIADDEMGGILGIESYCTYPKLKNQKLNDTFCNLNGTECI